MPVPTLTWDNATSEAIRSSDGCKADNMDLGDCAARCADKEDSAAAGQQADRFVAGLSLPTPDCVLEATALLEMTLSSSGLLWLQSEGSADADRETHREPGSDPASGGGTGWSLAGFGGSGCFGLVCMIISL
jgi:hypothetical protein